ncbi:hypothetical protein C8R45DRAFT_501226 [Mycena sanguinolenta]|nr:hypothetical protein C8R45DRAFT_501226 [Mycena sanguinolenta]
MQLYGLVSTNGLYAMVFHDELIPYAQFLRRFEHSPILRTYIIGYCTTEFQEAANYISDVIHSIDFTSLPVWIKSATGGLCLDLAPGPSSGLLWRHAPVLRLENIKLDAPDSEDVIISSLSEDRCHELCSCLAIARSQRFHVSTQHPVGLGIFRWDSQHGTCVRVTEPLVLPDGEHYWHNYEGTPGELLPNSWIRYDSHQTPELDLRLSSGSYKLQKVWLAQANYIFAEIQEEAHVQDYGARL